MTVTVKYSDETIYKFDRIEEITNPENVIYINCSDNQLESLPKNMDKLFPLLQVFYCGKNKLTSLPENMNFPQLTEFYCGHNKLKSLPGNMNFPQLTHFNCYSNRLTSLPENMNFPLLEKFYCGYNQLTSLPENMNFPQLHVFDCVNNKLTSLPENMNFTQLTEFYCDNNQLVSLPVCIMNWRNLWKIDYSGNEIELSPQLERFINRIHQGSTTKINVYSDTQNVHNSTIQGSVRDSINRLTTRRDLPKFDFAVLNTMILSDDVFLPTVKQQLIEYCQDDSVHSLLLLTFTEVLWYVLITISYDFANDVLVQNEIKRVLNQEIQDAECKCFTGRMNRVVNCLNGFSPLVEVKISDGEQIGNVIVMLQRKALDTGGNYSVEKHKNLVKHELQERGYDSETVSQWLGYIE